MTTALQHVSHQLQQDAAKDFTPFNVIITARNCTSDSADLVIGGPTFPDREESLTVGKSVLFNAGADGFVQLRLMEGGYRSSKVRLDKVSIHPQLFGAFEPQGTQSSFTPQDRETIRHGLDLVLEEVRKSALFNKEQYALLKEQLDEAAEATKRLTRKDWVLWFMGSVASLAITAGYPTDAVKALMTAVDHYVGQGALFAIRLLNKS